MGDFENLVVTNADIIGQTIGAVLAVASVSMAVRVAIVGTRWLLELVGGEREMTREEYDAAYPVDPDDADDWRNYDWNDDNDPQRHFH